MHKETAHYLLSILVPEMLKFITGVVFIYVSKGGLG